jgi:hypothetical protein
VTDGAVRALEAGRRNAGANRYARSMNVYDVLLYLALGISALIGIVVTLQGWHASRKPGRRRNRWRMW